MSFRIGSNVVINNDRYGKFKKLNPGTYATSDLPSAAKGDFVYDTTENRIKFWDGSSWK